MKSFFLSLLLSLLCVTSAFSQCPDPKPGSVLTEHTDLVVTYTDGYKTYMDVRYPSVAPGPCGWPMLVIVHTSGTSRDFATEKAKVMALRGFLVVTYDVRGQGPGMTLNDPLVYGREVLGIRERLDMFEIMEAVEAQFPNETDFDRIGVTGRSQGGLHSFLAAAHSGRPLPTNPWRTAPCPVVKAVAPINFGPQHMLSSVPENQSFSEAMTRQLFEDERLSGVHHTPDFIAFIRSYIDVGDFEGLINALFDPSLDPMPFLQTSTVPIYSQLVWDDKYGPINAMIRDWDTYLVPGTFKKMVYAVEGHNTPPNEHERELKEYRRIQFFEHILKNIDRNIDSWPDYRFAITPLDIYRHNDPTFLWNSIETDVYPFPDSYYREFFFDANNRMVESPPAGSASYTVNHDVQMATQDLYLEYLPRPSALTTYLQRNAEQFVMDPLDEQTLLLGSPTAKIRMNCAEADFQVEVSLWEHTTNRYLTSGFTTVRGHDGVTELELDLEMRMCAFHLPKGTVLRAEISNLAWHNTPTPVTFLSAIPVFSNYDLHVSTGGAIAPHIELPLLKWEEPILTTTAPYVLRLENDDRELALRCFDETMAGWSYQILASFSGTSPGTTYLGTHVPLNIDPLTNMIYKHPNQLPINNFQGTLDANGEAEADSKLSLIPFINPVIPYFDVCAVMVSPDGTEARVSNVVHLDFD